MHDRVLTWPRVIYVVVFTWLTANVSARFAYQEPTAGWLDYLVAGFLSAFVVVLPCVALGRHITRSLEDSEFRGLLAEAFGLSIATVIGIGFIGWLLLSTWI